ncbi:hypothetical protein [Anaerorhabdus sp.]|uniref:hypothetical protein n=1 Tax=Anaerorhabdus sp. TaxID=1872524 RepID=UPI002FCA43AC
MKKIVILLITMCLFTSITGCKKKTEKNFDQLSIANPYVTVTSVDDFKNELDIIIIPPENATNLTYSIINKKIAQIGYELNDIHYTYRASKLVNDTLHGIYDAVNKSEQFFINNGTEVLINTTDTDKKTVTWSYDNINYSLTIEGLIDNEDLLSFVQNDIEQLTN